MSINLTGFEQTNEKIFSFDNETLNLSQCSETDFSANEENSCNLYDLTPGKKQLNL